MYIGDENYIAGYIFSLDDIDSLESCIEDGVYSTNLSSPKKTTDWQFIWRGYHEGTFADYLSMKEGDNVYFFNNRNIYGVGELVKIKFVLEPILKVDGLLLLTLGTISD